MKISGNDILVVLGLIIGGVGIGMISVPAALIVVGGILFAIGIFGSIRKGAGL